MKLHLETLAVESFATDGALPEGDAAAPGISDGHECTRTLYLSCDTCKCNTVDYNCV